MPLTDQEKVAIRHHLGFLDVTEAATFVLGAPAAVETQFIIEGAMNRVKEQALPRLRQLLMNLETIEGQMIGDLELMAVNRLDEIEINQKEQRQLLRSYDYWVAALGNLLGCTRNPFDQRLSAPGRGGVNASVQH